MPDARLPWEPHPEGGYVAYSEGREKPERRAQLTQHHTGQIGQYAWRVIYDGEAYAGISDSRQEASDAANTAWPVIIAASEKAKRMATWEAHQMDMIAAVERGEIEPSYFANAAATQENMLWVMDRIRNKRPFSLHVERLVDALSRELYKFRTGQRK